MGLLAAGPAVKNHISSEMARELIATYPTSSSTTPSLTSPSSSQDSVFYVNRYTENPVPERSGSASEELRGKPLHEPTGTENNNNNNEGREEVQSDLLHVLRDWLQEFRENLVDETISTEPWGDPEHGSPDTSKSSHELPMESRAKVEPDSGKHDVYTHFPKDPNCDVCLKTKITGASCRRRTGTVVPTAEKFGDLITADHNFFSEGCESRNIHRYAVAVQDLATQWLQSYPCKTKTSQETQKTLQKFLEPNRKPKVIYIDNSLEFGKACEDLSWNQCTPTPHRSETNGIAERAVRRVKEGTSAVLLQSFLDENWFGKEAHRIAQHPVCHLKNAELPICEIFKISCLMGKLHTKGVLENFLMDPLSSLVHWLSIITPFLRETSQESINLERKCYFDYSLDTLCTRGEFGRVTQWLQTLRSWKRWTHRKSTQKVSMQRK